MATISGHWVERDAHYVEIIRPQNPAPFFDVSAQSGGVYCRRSCHLESRRSLKILPTRAGSFDLIYMDGSHLHRYVSADITAKRLIGEGGIFAGDLELERNEVAPSTYQAALAANRDYVHGSREMSFYHAGVANAVYESFPSISRFVGVQVVAKNRDDWGEVILIESSQQPVQELLEQPTAGYQ